MLMRPRVAAVFRSLSNNRRCWQGLPSRGIVTGQENFNTAAGSTPPGRPGVGVFLDAENLMQFMKSDGSRKLLQIALEFGNPVVRRAYGNWSMATLNSHQLSLVQSGFQLMHTPHPAAQKNSADIAMVVDVMDILHRMPNLAYFVLATGDSDFSHLFCHLRQAGRKVVGVGPRSTLSDVVKSSTDRYIYIDAAPEITSANSSQELGKVDLMKAFELLERVMENISTEEPVNASLIKTAMLSLDSAFEHKLLGFREFTTFLAASKLVNIHITKNGKMVTKKVLEQDGHGDTFNH